MKRRKSLMEFLGLTPEESAEIVPGARISEEQLRAMKSGFVVIYDRQREAAALYMRYQYALMDAKGNIYMLETLQWERYGRPGGWQAYAVQTEAQEGGAECRCE